MKNFSERNNTVQTLHDHLVHDAKMYIWDNYKKVTDWSHIFVEIRNGNPIDNANKKESVVFCKRSEEGSTLFYDPSWVEMETLTDVIYDESDGDLSVTVNGEEFWWVDAEACVSIAQFIESQLN